jgi:hypothetical protein
MCDLVLINFDPSRPTILLTDTSRLKGLGFALVHTEEVNDKERIRLVTCGSRSLNPAEKSYAIVKLEALAVKYGVEKCRYYLLGMQKFKDWSDHRPLVGIWRKQIIKIGNARCQKWRENLSVYNFEAGKQHFLIVVDRYSGFPLVAKLTLQSLESNIGHMEKMFYLLGRPGEIKCKNRPSGPSRAHQAHQAHQA